MKNNGFSLLELSIVLVIIGLIAGGIVAGASMIRAAELRSVITEFNQYQTAVHTFREKYSELPGDIDNAGAFWGYPGGNVANCPATAGTGTETCDGNGDGRLFPNAPSQYGERFTFWQHLANAGLIAGTYDGIAGSVSVNHSLETNVPASKLSGASWFVYNWNFTYSGHSTTFDGTYKKNSITIQGLNADGTALTPMLSPEEAWNIDTKIDDGKPAYGQVMALNWGLCTTATASDQLDATYALTSTDILCQIGFIDAF